MKKIYLIFVLMCFVVTMSACNEEENSIKQDGNFENNETEILETEFIMEGLEEKFLEKLREYTDENVATIVIEHFTNSDQYSAFIVTVPNQYILPEKNDEIYEYFIPSSLWYVDDSSCVNIYQNDCNGSILLASGTLRNGMCCVGVGHMSAYAPEVNYNTCYYAVENEQPVYLFTTASSIINEVGYIETAESFWEEERRIKNCIYDYQEGKLILIKETYVE